MDHVLAQLLRERVFGILTHLEHGASPETIRLIAAWRTILTLHKATESGSCEACGPRWRRHMCSVWRVATAYFIRHDHRYIDA